MELTRILIGDRELPIRIDLNVLEQIEERYETKEKFEQELLGWRFKRNEEGKYERKADGSIAIEYVKPSLKALIFILPRMINEGLKAEAYDNGGGKVQTLGRSLDGEYLSASARDGNSNFGKLLQ